ncbi:hypothetical protein BJX65DRAFT_262244 [Aspergillus insuetus]
MNLLISKRAGFGHRQRSVRQRSSELKDVGSVRISKECRSRKKGKSRDSRLARVFGFDGKEEQFDLVIHSRSQVREARSRLPPAVLLVALFIVFSQGPNHAGMIRYDKHDALAEATGERKALKDEMGTIRLSVMLDPSVRSMG